MPAKKISVKVENLSAASRRSYGIPEFWEDTEIRCRNCGNTFVFAAEQKKDWYECQQKHLCEQPVLCSRCFFEHSQRRRLKSRMDYALRMLKASPTEQAKLEAAETIVEYFQREKRGNIPFALHLLRDILRTHPSNGRARELCHAIESLQGS